jgi:hypothetical protein
MNELRYQGRTSLAAKHLQPHANAFQKGMRCCRIERNSSRYTRTRNATRLRVLCQNWEQVAQAAPVAERVRQFKCVNAATTMPIVSGVGLKNTRSAERNTGSGIHDPLPYANKGHPYDNCMLDVPVISSSLHGDLDFPGHGPPLSGQARANRVDNECLAAGVFTGWLYRLRRRGRQLPETLARNARLAGLRIGESIR